MYDSTDNTINHIQRVQRRLHQFIGDLESRSMTHDDSKLLEPEKSGIDATRARLLELDYGTPEYDEVKSVWSNHHHAVNDHHIEYYENGINGMTLPALVEWFCDNVAAAETHKVGDSIYKSLEHARVKYGINDQLIDIFENTAQSWGITRE